MEPGVGYNFPMRGKGFCRVCLRAVALALAAGILFVGGFAKDRRKDKRKPTSFEKHLRNALNVAKFAEGLYHLPEGIKLVKPENIVELKEMEEPGGVISEDRDYNLKKIKLSKEEFSQLWAQITSEYQKLKVKDEPVRSEEANGTTAYTYNLGKLSYVFKEWIAEVDEEALGDYYAIYYPLRWFKFGDASWLVGLSPARIGFIRPANDKNYYLGSVKGPPYSIAVPLSEKKFDLYVFRKDFNDGTGSYDFAVLRLKDAYKYGFTGSQERYDLWIGWDNASLHVWFEVPKGYEVVGLMPNITKRNVKLKNGEVVPVYARSLYLCLKNERGERYIVSSWVAEGKYGISVGFALGSSE